MMLLVLLMSIAFHPFRLAMSAFRALLSENGSSSISFREDGRYTFSMAVQPLNMVPSIFVALFGRYTFISDTHPKNMPTGIVLSFVTKVSYF